MGKEKREGGEEGACQNIETRLCLELFCVAGGAGLGGCLSDPPGTHLRAASESDFLVLPYQRVLLQLQLT